ncbi:deiodinase [Desmophyllum pertusum]|uniref:Iodothyronine deiodinase n=1 Tax=Desmophyllum pertusum TaxID=174260 RepID=A0A9W9YNS8_9CNID|nr:deiodinase [Desmophyllum pertusum]
MLAELSHNIILGITALKFTILVGLLRIASAIPYIKERIQKYEEHYLLVPYQNFWDDYGSNEMLSCVLKIVLGDLNKTARLGNPAPNCKVKRAWDRKRKSVNFSISSQRGGVHSDSITEFVLIRVLPQNNVEIAQHKSLKERCQAAQMLKKSSQSPVPIMVDTLHDEATIAYGAFPERLFVIQQGQIVYEGGTGPYNYVLAEVQSWLEEYKAKQ